MHRIVFMGSPEFALPVLRNLAVQYPVVGVITQPDRPAGRGRVLTPPPIRILADELNLPVIQPRRLSEPDAIQQINLWAPDLIVVVAFGQILRPSVLDLPQFGCINVHASLLPRWRGAAPIQAAILHGDEQTGITIMRMDPGIDTGPTLVQKSIQIAGEDTAGTLIAKLSEIGANLLMETLPPYLSGKLVSKTQDDSLATYAPMIKKEDGLLDFTASAIDLDRKIRAFNPWPGAYTILGSQFLKIHRAHAVEVLSEPAGKKIIYQELPAITTGKGILVIDELQPAGRNILDGKAFLRGARSWGLPLFIKYV
jgi:methionyl-tRNA formyltransferase